MKPHAHTRMLTPSNMHKHTSCDKVGMETTWDLERERDFKKEGNSTHIFFKSRHCKLFALHSRLCDAHVYINSLRMEAASFAITLYLLTALEGHRELHLKPEARLRNAESTVKMERWEDTSHTPEDHRGESPAELACDSSFSQRTLRRNLKEFSESLEILLTPSLLPLTQQKPCAFCFECLVATSPYLTTLSLQLLTCLYLP